VILRSDPPYSISGVLQIKRFAELNILQLVLIHPEIMAQFMDVRQADLFADFGLAGADRLNILLRLPKRRK